MSSDRGERIYQLYLRAKDLPEAEREALLAGEDLPPDVLAELRALLRNTQPQDAGGSPVSQMVNQLKFGLIAPASDDLPAPTVIGPYQILSVLGEGGYGVVYLAERREPMVQRVAIKLIKPGMDSKAVIARFEQERQALAVMEHPGVARVLDGGTTPDGRPYFVMEYVKGEPINTYCDSRRLPIKARLDLFITVCEAVQHAHHKGIIHRDLKPSNILVTEVEGHAVPKVIDFGVAKAVSHTLTEKTIFTQHGGLIGTPEYMSPEQANIGAIDIDTRTDVYSLGVVLYELVTGLLPFDPHELRSKGYQEIQRIIREVDPPRPSTRLSGADDVSGTRIALARAAERERLASDLRRELEWIPLKAMRKERERRYRSPADLAADVHNYLDGRALEAAPDSRAYLMRKFVRRNRGAVAAGGAVLVSLLIGLSTTLYGLAEARRQTVRADERAQAANFAEAQAVEQRAAAEASAAAEKARAEELKTVSEFQANMLSQVDPTTAGVRLSEDVQAKLDAALAKSGVNDAERTAQVDQFMIQWYQVNPTDTARDLIDRTILTPAITAIDERFTGQPVVDAQLRQALADVYRTMGLFDSALPLQTQALATRRNVLGNEHEDTIASISNTGNLLEAIGRTQDAEPLYREALEKSERILGREHPSTLQAINNMGSLLHGDGKLNEALPYYDKALEVRRRVLGKNHPSTLDSTTNMGLLLKDLGRLDEATPYLREALDETSKALGKEHPTTLDSISNMGFLLKDQDKLIEAEPYYREALESSRRVLGEEHPNTITSINNMGMLLKELGRFREAEPLLREALDKIRRTLGPTHPDAISAANNLGMLLIDLGHSEDAEPYLRDALEKRRRLMGEEHPNTLISLNSMGVLLQAQGRLYEATTYFREALAKRRRVLGDNHPNTILSMNKLGSSLQSMGNYPEAEALFREALARSCDKSGDNHPDSLVSLCNLASVLVLENRAAEAVDLLTPAEPAARIAFSTNNVTRLAAALLTLGRARASLAFDQTRFTLAESNLLEAWSLLRETRVSHYKDKNACVEALANLYGAWETSDPGKGHGTKAAEWAARLASDDFAAPTGER